MTDGGSMALLRRIAGEKRGALLPLSIALILNVAVYAFVVYPMEQRVANRAQRAASAETGLRAAQQEQAAAHAALSGKARANTDLARFYADILPASLADARRLTHLRLAQMARLVRSGMLEMLGQDFVRTARAKGLRERVVLGEHALRNALLPLITVIGLELGTLLNGSVVIENVFGWPGVGKVLISALQQRDIPVVEAGVFLVAAIYIALNLAVDLLYAFIDPRVRYG